ncbi:MAG: hypothetical protein IID45_10255 [Planctomycetes bacterium]|nr:hypothetical protein [Planctomycetota bacterium]
MSQLLTSHVSEGNGSGHVNRLDALETKVFDLGGEVAEFRRGFDAEVGTAHFHVMRLKVHFSPFNPKGPKGQLPLIAQFMPQKLARQIAVEFNEESIRTKRGRWHIMVIGPGRQNYGVLRIPMAPPTMPDDPHAFPDESPRIHFGESICERDQVCDAAEKANWDILQVARVPLQWNVAVRSLKDDPESDGNGCAHA